MACFIFFMLFLLLGWFDTLDMFFHTCCGTTPSHNLHETCDCRTSRTTCLPPSFPNTRGTRCCGLLVVARTLGRVESPLTLEENYGATGTRATFLWGPYSPALIFTTADQNILGAPTLENCVTKNTQNRDFALQKKKNFFFFCKK